MTPSCAALFIASLKGLRVSCNNNKRKRKESGVKE